MISFSMFQDFLGSSLSGIVLLFIGIFPQLYALYSSTNPFLTINSFCKTRMYWNQVSAMSCRWLLVLACIDRWISSSMNHRIRSFTTVTLTRSIVLITIVFWHILPIHTLIYSQIEPPNYRSCSISSPSIAVYHRFYTIIMGGALPTFIVMICSYFLWKNFQQRQQRLLIMCHLTERRRKIRDQQVLLMLLVQILIFFISTIPFMSFNIYDTLTQSMIDKSIERKSIEASIKTITELLIYLITLSFYSNTLVSRTFRKELFILFKLTTISRRCRRHSSQVIPTNHRTPTRMIQTTSFDK